MADGISIDIAGLAEVKAKLEALGTTQARSIVRKALKVGAAIVQEAIEVRIPARPDLPSSTALPIGALRSDIVIKMKESNPENPAAVVTPDDLTIHVADWVETGHRLVRGGYSRETKPGSGKYRGPGQEVGTVEAYPYIREAYELSREEAAQAIATTLITEIEKAAK